MKTKIFILTVLLFGLITQKSNAQISVTNNSTYTVTAYVGWSGGHNLPFATGGLPAQMTLATNGDLGIGTATPAHLLDVSGGDIDVFTPTDGYMIDGFYVLRTLQQSTNNLMVGMGAGANVSSGIENTFAGSNAGVTTTTGSGNIAVGYDALERNSVLGGNTAVGDSALYTLNIASLTNTGNVAIGNSALWVSQGSLNNTAVGEWALRNGSGNSDVAVGYNALYNNGAAYGNTAIGNYAGAYTNTGLNTFLGDSAGWGCTGTSDTNDVFIGWQSGPQAAQINPNYVYVGSAYTTHISSAMAIITTWSDRRIKDNIQANVPGLDFITKITPVTYHYDLNKAHQLGVSCSTGGSSGKAEVEQITQSGFIAQQVDSAAQACGYDFSGVVKPTTPGGAYALGYSEFVVPLVKSVQELNTKNQTLSSTVDSLRSALQSMQTCLNQICAATGNNNANATPASEQNVTLNSANSPVLYQNSPNPFNTGTKINYYLPEGTMDATIVFYDTYGNQIKTVQLNQTGNGTLTITPDNLTNGIYSYSLIVNNTVVDTKKMVLQK